MADGVRILNPGAWNECLIRPMTEEEKAKYGPPKPLTKAQMDGRMKAKQRSALSNDYEWFTPTRTTKRTKQEATPMSRNERIDRVRMRELFEQYGPGHTAAKKIAGELGCSWSTVEQTIKKEGWQQHVEVAPTVITHVTPADGPIPPLKVEDIQAVPEETPANPIPVVTELIIDVPDGSGGTIKQVITEAPCTEEPDAAYFSALDDLARMYTNEPDFRKCTNKAIAKEGLRGLHQLLAEKNVSLWENLKSVNDPSGVELSSLLMQIANTAVQGLMFLETLEEW